jgi:hypothetical protein
LGQTSAAGDAGGEQDRAALLTGLISPCRRWRQSDLIEKRPMPAAHTWPVPCKTRSTASFQTVSEQPPSVQMCEKIDRGIVEEIIGERKSVIFLLGQCRKLLASVTVVK